MLFGAIACSANAINSWWSPQAQGWEHGKTEVLDGEQAKPITAPQGASPGASRWGWGGCRKLSKREGRQHSPGSYRVNSCPDRLFESSAGNHKHTGLNPPSTAPAQRKDAPPRRKTHPEVCIHPYFRSSSHSGKSPFLNADITLSSLGKYSCSCRWLNRGSSEKVPVNRISHRDCPCADFRAPANAKQNVPAGWLELMCFALHLHLAQSLTEASCRGKSDKELSFYYSTACKYLLYLWWGKKKKKKSCRKSTPLPDMEAENGKDLVQFSSSLLRVSEDHTPRGNSHFSITRIMDISARNVIHLEKA